MLTFKRSLLILSMLTSGLTQANIVDEWKAYELKVTPSLATRADGSTIAISAKDEVVLNLAMRAVDTYASYGVRKVKSQKVTPATDSTPGAIDLVITDSQEFRCTSRDNDGSAGSNSSQYATGVFVVKPGNYLLSINGLLMGSVSVGEQAGELKLDAGYRQAVKELQSRKFDELFGNVNEAFSIKGDHCSVDVSVADDGQYTLSYNFPSYEIVQPNGDVLIKKERVGTLSQPNMQLYEGLSCKRDEPRYKAQIYGKDFYDAPLKIEGRPYNGKMYYTKTFKLLDKICEQYTNHTL